MPRLMKNSRISIDTSERAMKPASRSSGSCFRVCSAVSRISRSLSEVRTIRMPSCSSGRGAIAPCAARRRMSRATSPRRKKSSIGVLWPAAMSVSNQEVLVVVAADAGREHVARLAEDAAGLSVDAELHGRRIVAEQQQLVAEFERQRFALLHGAADDLVAISD